MRADLALILFVLTLAGGIALLVLRKKRGGAPLLIGGIVLGIITSLIIVLCQAGDLNSVHREPAAKNYVRPGSMKLTTQTEQFLNKRVDRVAKSDSSSGAAAGAAAAHHHSSSSSGSTTHTSSSGTTHGGSSGKF